MKRCLILSGLLATHLIFSTRISGIELNYPIHACDLASSNISLLSESASSSFHNPSQFNRGLSFSYSNPFSMSEIVISSIVFSDQIRKINYSIGNQNFYEERYNENHFYINFNFPYQHFVTGVNFRYLFQQSKHYKAISVVQFDAGIKYQKYPINTSIFCNNISSSEYQHVKLPILYQAEILYHLQKKSQIGFSIEENDSDDLVYKIGNRSELSKNLEFLASYHINRSQFSFGAEIQLSSLKFSYGIQMHEYLNPSHSISIDYIFE